VTVVAAVVELMDGSGMERDDASNSGLGGS